MDEKKVRSALRNADHVQDAASLLGVTRQGLYAWLDRNGYVVKRRAYLVKRKAVK